VFAAEESSFDSPALHNGISRRRYENKDNWHDVESAD
jgi:hypothetical protein